MKRLIVALAMLCLSSAAAFAQEVVGGSHQPTNPPDYGPYQGAWDASLGVSGAVYDEYNDNGWGATGQLGYFVDDLVEVGFRQSGNFFKNDFNYILNGNSRFFVDYNLPILRQYRVYPYVGLVLGYTYGDEKPESITLGPDAGIKYYFLRQTYWYAGGEYQVLLSKIGNPFRESEVTYSTGVGFHF